MTNTLNSTPCPKFSAACRNDDLDSVKNLFVEYKIVPDCYLFTSGFRTACKNHSTNVVRWFYSAHNKICTYTLLKINTDFELACLTDDIANAKKYYSENNICADMFNIACRLNHVVIAKFLHSVNINRFNVDDELFSNACYSGHYELAKWLWNVSINAGKECAFINACGRGHFEIAKWLHELQVDIHTDDDRAFINACGIGHFKIAKWLHSVGINTRNNKDYAFIVACCGGHLELAQWLYSLGADIHAQNSRAFGDTMYRNKNHAHILRWLYELDCMVVIYNLSNMNLLDDDDYNYESILTSNLEAIGIDRDTQDFLTEIMNDTLELIDVENDDETYILDVVIRALFYYNRIHSLEELNLPYVSYDIVDGKIVNGVINRCRAKNARNVA